MNCLLTQGPKPLRPEQILVAMLNQIRRLLLAKAFLAEATDSGWHQGCSFNEFKNSVLSTLQRYDRQLLEQIDLWEQLRDPADSAGSKKAKKKRKSATDLILLANPHNAYPVYLLLKKAANISMQRLLTAYDILHRTDHILKSGSENKTQALERAVITICNRPG